MPEDDPPVLSPDPAEVVVTITRIVAAPWPTTDGERRAMFSEMAFLERSPAGESERTPGVFSTSLGDQVDGYWSTFNGEFLGLNFFLYLSPDPTDPKPRAGYDALRRLLSDAFGAPREEWGPAHMPASAWTIRGLSLSMYCHGGGNGGVQVGLEHAERTAAYSAAHAADPGPRH
ncbi:hypothetical protein [Kribbella voronezhensis]|uniref:hypothetical protein n=1 Tax=Kribbella voronezhensis TaxID=2512212 RepID=UPI00106428B9|nr:hypothetical protein [Kribbella voronezhensis]